MQGSSNIEKLQILVVGYNTIAVRQLAERLKLHSSTINLVAAYDPGKFTITMFEDALAGYSFVQTRPLDPKSGFSHQVGTLPLLIHTLKVHI